MLIAVAAVGRMKSGPERELVTRYLERARAGGRPLALTGFAVTEIAESRAGAAGARKAEEARALAAAIPPGHVTVALDERARAMGSEPFAERLAAWRDAGRPGVGFVIGGADGLDSGLIAEAELAIGFSAFTWPHQLVRIMLAEQLYRATTILAGHPYHRA